MPYHTFSMVGSNGDRNLFKGVPTYYGSSLEDSRQDVFSLIDPCLETSNTVLGDNQGHYMTQVSMQRYLSEQQNLLFQTARPHDGQFSATEPKVIPPPASRLQGRQSSPFSQNQSSVASGVHSPRTESDLYFESTQGPSTPPDLAIGEPFMNSLPYDQWDYHSSQVSLTGLVPPGGCVNPSEISPSQHMLMECHDNEPPTAFTLHRVSSFDSTSSSQYQETAPYHSTFLHSEPKQPYIKSEFQTQLPQAPTYPDPESIDEDVKSSDEIVVQRASCDDDNEDEEYKPNTRSRPSRDARTIPRRPRSKRSSAATLPGTRTFKNTTSSKDVSRRLQTLSGSRPCVDCHMAFKDEASLQKHTKTQHTRPFICVFHWAGCTSTFATKNEWKRHVSAQHLALYYYLCTHDSCGHTTARSSQQSRSTPHSGGRPFRRKDLFTQHARRMHTPTSTRKVGKAGISYEWEEKLKIMQENALRQRCHLPTYMRCPAQDCTFEFRGEKAWDERMEHVAKHLEHAANDEEPKVQFGGPSDDTLTLWAQSEGVNVVRRTPGGWTLCSPLKDMKFDHTVRASMLDSGSADEDAEGEPYFQ